MKISSNVRDGEFTDPVFSTVYSSESTSIDIMLTTSMSLSTHTNNEFLLEVKEGTGTPVAPYVTPNLATFYEVCFVQKNINTPLTTMQTTLLGITALELYSVKPFHLCVDSTGYHPIVVEINVPNNPPALSTDNFTLKITSDTDQAPGLTTNLPFYLSEGSTVTVDYDTNTQTYSIYDWESDLTTTDTWYLYLPSALIASHEVILNG